MNIHTWKLSRDNLPIAQVLRFMPNIDQTMVVTNSLDGTPYIQTIGSGRDYAEVTIFSSFEEMKKVNKAWSEGAVLSLIYKSTQYIGYIKEAPSWEATYPGQWYQSTINFLIEGEVSV